MASPTPIFIDTDMGCDDAVAVAWLLRQPTAHVVGISTLFGNSTVQNTTANVLTLLAAAGRQIPLTQGAAAPLVHPYAALGSFIHGPDGFWGQQQPHDLSLIANDLPAALAAAARAYPGLTVLALGPLTNIAHALQAYPQDLAGVRLVALAGARGVGNITPVAEFNAFADPHALAFVLASAMQVELVTLDAFAPFLMPLAGLAERIAGQNPALTALFTPLLAAYAHAEGHVQADSLAIPDAVAAIYALYPHLGVAQPAFVRVMLDDEYVRGQTIIALSPQHQAALAIGATGIAHMATMTANPEFDVGAALGELLGNLPHNTRVVLEVDLAALRDVLLAG